MIMREICEDVISRKEVFETFGELLGQWGRKALMEIPSVTPTQRWIPISERLPNIHNRREKYYVTLKSGDVDIATFTECNGEHWWNFNSDDVVAWQPLPKPYKEEMEDEDDSN